jgi:hypothetical protein
MEIRLQGNIIMKSQMYGVIIFYQKVQLLIKVYKTLNI